MLTLCWMNGKAYDSDSSGYALANWTQVDTLQFDTGHFSYQLFAENDLLLGGLYQQQYAKCAKLK